jgi:hypothetical protein
MAFGGSPTQSNCLPGLRMPHDFMPGEVFPTALYNPHFKLRSVCSSLHTQRHMSMKIKSALHGALLHRENWSQLGVARI